MIQWKDITSFSQHDKERIPTCFECKNGDMNIVVTCSHINYRGEWVMHCRALGIDTLHMPTVKTYDEAKERAVKIISKKLDRLVANLSDIEKL